MGPLNPSTSVYDLTSRKRSLADDELRQLLEESDDDDFIGLLESDTEELVETDDDVEDQKARPATVIEEGQSSKKRKCFACSRQKDRKVRQRCQKCQRHVCPDHCKTISSKFCYLCSNE
ncbi:hypothetical protein ILUMI_22016 [Ignelater luminosus]|uniref:PiggyBac transposable element-derived protein 4 C-terminal zinc-ribbon domain-containing protein n=1 Tax=Ignelater luminosus TaxID=2038154 RepID=A0A8K0G0X0_IGNLU|nr:hypothetical protein ILUMI_22016 [Ignelater luminosus]